MKIKSFVIPIVLILSLLGIAPISAQSKFAVYRYTEADGVMGSVNSYLIESENGIVIVDSQRVLSQGSQVAARAKKLGKPVLAILLTHSHPDHVGGLAALAKQFPSALIYADKATYQEITSDSLGYFALSRDQFGNDFAAQVPVPTKIVANGDTFDIDNISYRVDDLGTGESLGMTLYYLPHQNILFSGDLVEHDMTPMLLEQHTKAWLSQLVNLLQEYGTTPEIYPGHGLPSDFDELVRAEIGELTTMRYLVSSYLDDGTLSNDETTGLVNLWQVLYPNHPSVAMIPDLLPKDFAAVAQELKQESSMPTN